MGSSYPIANKQAAAIIEAAPAMQAYLLKWLEAAQDSVNSHLPLPSNPDTNEQRVLAGWFVFNMLDTLHESMAKQGAMSSMSVSLFTWRNQVRERLGLGGHQSPNPKQCRDLDAMLLALLEGSVPLPPVK